MVDTVNQGCHFKAMTFGNVKKYFLGAIYSNLTRFLEQKCTPVVNNGNFRKSGLLLLSSQKNVQTHRITVKFGPFVIESLLPLKIN